MSGITKDDLEAEYYRGLANGRKMGGGRSELNRLSCWQPIETAPRDGTEILMYLPSVSNVVSGNWGVNGGWIDCWCSSLDYYTPTLWMPKPQNP